MNTFDKFSRPLKDLRISVTDRCNFRCTYCMPAEIFGERYEFLPRNELLNFEEITRLAYTFAKLGVTKIRLTGGEPLLRTGLPSLVKMLSSVPGIEDLALTTNGFLLDKYAQELKEAGLNRITVSMDSLDNAVFQEMNGRGFGTKKVLDGIEAAENAGLTPIKINAVIQKSVNDQSIVDLINHFKTKGHIVRFIEFMDVGTLNGWDLDQVVPAKEIVNIVSKEHSIEPVKANYAGEVALRYRFTDGSGEFGIIPSVTQPFCSSCSRMRLSPDGHFYTCLFGDNGFNIRDALRDGQSDSYIESLIQNIWTNRTDQYSELRSALSQDSPRSKVEMYHIGG
jgi:cyclic pyranopterin phosphate synthase